jgi:hypothetical protein
VLYKLRAGEDPFLLNDGLRVAYPKLHPQQMMFVILLCDPSRDNPVRTLSGKARRERAAIIAGYTLEADGKRLAKNGRDIVAGNVPAIEDAIEEFKKNHYNEREKNKQSLRNQITEIREFLDSDKKIPRIKNGKVAVNKEGQELFDIDHKALELSVKLGVKLPDLEEALSKLEALDPIETKFEGTTYTASDLKDEVAGDETLSLIDQLNLSSQQL